MVEELKSGTYKDLCSTCGIDKNKPRDLVILDCNPLSYALDLDSRCPECEHYASGQTLLSLKEWKYKLINKAEERGRKEGAITELDVVEDSLLGIIMVESQPAKIITEFRVWLQERIKTQKELLGGETK